ILMYHRVAADREPDPLTVTPERFAEQVEYLHAHGYRSLTLGQWSRSGKDGPAVVLTFDDGYRDFLENAFPILQQHGFTATVFMIPDHVGRAATWSRRFGDPVPLLSWDEIERLSRAGIEFGSHTASHRPLTALPPRDALEQ